MSIMEYNGGSVVAMKGKNCVAIGGFEDKEERSQIKGLLDAYHVSLSSFFQPLIYD
jgi:20S proteasome alpha/beta subunit